MFLPVEAAYDRWAASYDSDHNPMVFMASEAISALDFHNCRVFEFGCGTGRNLQALSSLGVAAVAGCDLSERMLDVARTRCPGADVFRHDMTMPLPGVADQSLDVALFSLSLEHVADLLAPLREARRIVRPGGRIAIFEIHPFLSLEGVAAHFTVGGEEIRMPTIPHQFADYLRAFAELELRVITCREWRPREVARPAPARALKRGPDFPLLVQFVVGRYDA